MELEAQLVAPRRDARVIGLVSTGHFFSHFYMLLLPPLFPLLREIYGVGYTELGFAITVFSLTTGLTQAPVGFLVDRYGARALLIAGVLLESLAFALIGVFPVYGVLLGLMVLAGLANAVYHPADYAILNAAVDQKRMGRAFSIHTFAGFVGEALAPVTMIALMTIVDWRAGLIACGCAGIAVAIVMALNSEVLNDAHIARSSPAPQQSSATGMRLLFSAPILMGLLFFVGLSLAGRGVNGFSVATLHTLYDTPLTEASAVLAAFFSALYSSIGWI